ncbi:MMPL family transporter [Halobacteria archaeon AArc-m2/3/4]|uniref:MMPL family transporter n=1 Tax=Natronoglomus mannanivorans TaxID=2979990 RepID=A0AAP2YV07_9EURY|nr:MMPL family transporter [Halobacteria archaeon AArc-xg1-1]MCU4973058.1 MMPL family transporter [Halobacteria archaeon AArc-m2/3/4]
MSLPDRLAATITEHTKIVLVVLLLTTALVGAGATMVDDDSSLDQFESDSPEGEAAEYITENFVVDDAENTTSVQLFVRGNGDNVLRQDSIVSSLEFQQEIKDNESINATLAADDPIFGVENVIATSVVRGQQAEELGQRGAELEARGEQLNETAGHLQASLEEAGELQREYEQLNVSYEQGEVSDEEYQQQAGEIEAGFDRVFEEATADLDDDQTAQFDRAMSNVRSLNAELVQNQLAFEAGEISEEEYEQEEAAIQEELETVFTEGTSGVLADEYDELQEESEALEEEQEELQSAGQPSLDEQIEAVEALDEEEYESILEDTLSDDEGDNVALQFMPSSYDPGSTTADARMAFVTQLTDGNGGMEEMGEADDRIVQSQLDLRTLANAQDQDYVVFGFGVISDEIDRSMADSLAIVGPLALIFVVLALMVAYRDPLDIVLGVAGIIAVLIWTFGFMGWAGISFNQMFVAVPVLLIGLSIDYAIHVFMRHREQRESEGVTSDVRGSMTVALAGVGVALVWVTATTIIGFLSNLVSPIAPIREFGVVSSVGIFAALVVFGALVPAAKIEIDSFLESRGFDRRKRAFGTGGGRFSDVLSVGSVAARKAPLIVIVAVLLLTAGGVYGASQVDTSFDEEDFLADNPPEWTQHLGPLAPGEYQAKSDLQFVNDNFQREDAQAQILVRGDVADAETLERINQSQTEAVDRENGVIYVLPNGDADVQSPLSVMERVAAENESFNASFQLADTNDNGVPDRNIGTLYDELFDADHAAASEVVHRTDDGDYEAVRMIVGVQGSATAGETTEEMRTVAGTIDDDGTDSRWTAIATGDPIINYIVEQDLLNTVLESLLITLVAVFAFLTISYWATGNSASLGAVTLLPVAFAVSWILGTMYLLGMPFNVLTGMITSLTIGLGVAYSIHISARYTLELDRQGSVWDAMHTTVTGTGGALLGSAATTVGGFGVLSFAILPALRQFGIITALTITYAFLASVVVLPTLLVLWTRYFGPDVSFASQTESRAQPASDGGVRTDTDGESDE